MDIFFGRSQRLVILTASLAWGYFCCVGELRDGMKGIQFHQLHAHCAQLYRARKRFVLTDLWIWNYGVKV